MRKIKHDAVNPFWFIQMEMPYVTFKIRKLFINSREECKELYDRQAEEITCAKDVANWIRDTYAKAKKSMVCYMKKPASP